MIYYKVISKKLCPAFRGRYYKDNIFSYRYDNGVRVSEQYIADELFTAAELRKFYGITAENMKEFPFLEKVEIPKSKIHFSFGCRFSDSHNFYYNKDGSVFAE